jgi:hypothetical protein
MSQDQLTLRSVDVHSFGGINKENPIVLDLTQANKEGKNIIVAEADQAKGKSSWLAGLIYLASGWLQHKLDSYVNKKDNTISLDQIVERNGTKYKIKATKSRFTVERFFEYPTELEKQKKKEDGQWVNQDNPKTLLKELIGIIGVSPMALKDMKPKDQMKWMRELAGFSDEAEQEEEKLKGAFKTAYDSRTDANREYNRLKTTLAANELFNNWEASEKIYSEEKTIEDAKKKLDEAIDHKTQLDNSVRWLKTAKEEGIPKLHKDMEDLNDELKRLQEKITNKHNEIDALKKRTNEAADWCIEHERFIKEYNEAQQEYDNISQLIIKQNEWKRVVQEKKDMDEFETLVQKFDSQKDDLQKQIKELIKKYTPNVPGLEIFVPNEEEKREGPYYNEMSLAQLSESEIYGLFFRMWKTQDVKFVYIENANTLGSEAVGILNQLAEDGVKIFATLMNKEQKTIRITFMDRLN